MHTLDQHKNEGRFKIQLESDLSAVPLSQHQSNLSTTGTTVVDLTNDSSIGGIMRVSKTTGSL
jgi:hypothetical protein